MPTFKNIEDDCVSIINLLKTKLYEKLNSAESSNEQISESIELLCQLGEPLETLCDQYISRSEKFLDQDLSILTLNIDLLSSNSVKNSNEKKSENLNQQIAMDILEFVDYGCNHFLANLSSIIQSFNLMFLDQQYLNK